jgi:hypothetical protein
MAEILLIDKNDLKQTIRETVEEMLKEKQEPAINEADFMQRMTRKEAAKFLGCSYQALGIWTRAGKVKQYGTGRKAYYLKKDLMNIKPDDQWKAPQQ